MDSAEETRFLESSLLFFCNFVLALIFFCGIAANVLVLLVFNRKPGLRTTANRFVINLIIINIICCVSLLPITFANNIVPEIDEYFCFAERFTSVFCSSAIVYSVLLIAVDQYFAVVNPLHYHCIISSWKGYLMIVATWVFSIGLALIGAVQPDFDVYRKSILKRCDVHSDSDSNYQKEENLVEVSTVESSQNFYHIIFGVTYATTAFAIPFVLICFIYYSICVAASGNNKRARTSVLSNEENSQMIRNKLQGVGSETESPGAKLPEDNRLLEKSVNVSDDNRESTRLNEGNRLTSNPSFVVTRPSPPNPQIREPEVDPDFKRVDKDVAEDVCETEVAQMIAGNKFPGKENSLKVKTECEVPLLKPTLKNNSSFTKLSTLHIQFSNSTEKITEKNPAERRHSNILLGTVDPEFENIGKSRSSSMESNFYEISSRSSFSTRSTTTSNQIQSSRSSSLNSTYARLPPSRASSIRSTSSYIVHNIRHRISNASLFRYREETRAARISAMVIVMALLCWLPFFIVISLYPGICLGKFPHFPYYLDAFSIVLLLASTIISPFLFAFRNRQIKKEIRKIFQFCPNSNWNCTKSFYTHNFSLSLKSQTVQLLTELGKGTNTKPKNGHAGCSS